MSQIINELATIEVSNEILQQLDMDGIYASFSKNYRKLDELKDFRSDYEKKNRLMRWWHNDKLRDAQLDSAEVQAEFSKTIGQLMILSIMQSRKLSEQQTQLNEQQGKLKLQADGIARHAGELQKQHHVLAEQSEKLETLVHEYFALKGLTEDGAQRLIEIAGEVKATKQSLLDEFSVRAGEVEILCGDVRHQMEALSAGVAEQIRLSAEQAWAATLALQHETREQLIASDSTQREERQALQQSIERSIEQQKASHAARLNTIDGAITGLAARSTDLANALSEANTGLNTCVQQQQTYQDVFANFQQDVARKLRLMGYIATGLSITVLGWLGWHTY